MIRLVLVLGVFALLCACAGGPSQAPSGPTAVSSGTATLELPVASLDRLYPPQSEVPVLNVKMLEMAASLAGVVVNMHEGDFEHAGSRFVEFRDRYVELARLIPEWEPAYAMGPVDELGKAVENRDVDQLHTALGKLDPVCGDCHVAHTAQVQQRYYWKDWAGIAVDDPVTGSEMGFKQFKQQMWASFAGIGIDLEEGQMEHAVENFKAFQARFLAFEATCVVCHDTERRYYLDDELKASVTALGTALATGSPDPAVVGKFSREIGSESCQKCHLVHSPAALARTGWNRPRS